MAKEVGGHGGMDSLWTAVWFTACRMVFRWIWTFMIWQNGAAWQSWVNSLWTMVVLLLRFPILPVVNGIGERI